MRVTQLETSRSILNDLDRLNRLFTDTNYQLSSGKKLTKLSDSPLGSSDLVDITEQALRLDAYRFNIIQSTYQLRSADNSLNQVTNILTTVFTLGSNAANEPTNKEGRQAILNQMETLREELVALGNTQVEGRYIFAGTDVFTKPFELVKVDPSAGTPPHTILPPPHTALNTDLFETKYNGNNIVNSIPVGDGVEVVGSISGQDLIAALNSVDDIINAIKESIPRELEAGPPPVVAGIDNAEGIGKALENFDAVVSAFSQARGKIGVGLNLVERMSAMIDSRDLILKEQRGRIEDANLAEVAMRIGQLQTALNAAVSSGGVILQQRTLFDYIG